MPGASLTEDAFKDGIVDVITLVHQAGLALHVLKQDVPYSRAVSL